MSLYLNRDWSALFSSLICGALLCSVTVGGNKLLTHTLNNPPSQYRTQSDRQSAMHRPGTEAVGVFAFARLLGRHVAEMCNPRRRWRGHQRANTVVAYNL